MCSVVVHSYHNRNHRKRNRDRDRGDSGNNVDEYCGDYKHHDDPAPCCSEYNLKVVIDDRRVPEEELEW